MPLLILLLLPIAEIYVLFQVGAKIGVINTVFALLAAGVLGAGLAKVQGRYVLAKMQASLARGEVPTKEVFHGLLLMIGGVLFLFPGFVSDFAGLVFVLPGTRHILVKYMRQQIAQKLKAGQFRVFSTGGGFGGGFGGMGPFRQPNRPGPTVEDASRDVTPKVIDVVPLSSSSEQSSDSDDDRNR